MADARRNPQGQQRGEALSRLAFRQEGAELVVYLAEPHTMEGALRVGSAHLCLLERPGAYDEYVAWVSESYRHLIEKCTGERVASLETRPVPEHERAGHA